MALQVKKNKNQFIRKATASSSVNKTIQDVSNVDVSAILSGVESVQIDTPNVNTGQINVNTGQINVHLTNKQTCTEGVKPFAGYEQPTCTEASGRSGKPEENFDPGGTMHAPTIYSQHSDYIPKLHSDSHSKPSTGSGAIKISASGNISENQAAENPRTLEDLPFMTGAAQRSRHSEAPGHPDGSHTDTNFSHLVHQHVPGSRHFEPHGHPDGSHTDTNFSHLVHQHVPGSRHFEPHGHPDESHTDTYVSQLTYQHMLNQRNTTPSPGQRTSERTLYDHVDNNHAPPLPKTPPPELPAKPPRMAKNETWGQHSSPSLNRGANQQRSTAFKKDHSSRPQKQDGHQFSNNLDDDGEENEDIVWEYPGERKVIDHRMMASNIQYPNFKEQAQMQYREDGTWYNNEQGGYHDQSSKAGQMLGGQYGKQTWQIPGSQPGGPMQQMQGGLNEGNIGNTHSHGRNFGYTSSWQKEGNSGQLQYGQHAKGHFGQMHGMEYFGFKTAKQPAGSMGPVPTSHHEQGGYHDQSSSWQKERNSSQLQDGQHAKGHFGQVHGMDDVRFKTAGQPAGSMGPVPTIHHAGTMGQMPYQQNEGSMQQMQGGLHGGAMGKMHPHAQFEAMHPYGKEYMGEFQNVQHQPEDMGQLWDFPPEPCQGDGQGDANYSQGASNFPGPSTNMTDQELASEQFDQRMNNPWFQQMVQNMKELVEKEGLIVKDVFPDGNCLFTAVIDQLRVRGNFTFTPSTLRAAALTFLKEHPKQHDGTHLEQFLMNESWDQYLDRMSRDGVWGEHIILGAMSEVLKCRIIVLGGMSGKSRTVVQPQHVYDEEEKEMQKEKEEANGCKTVKDEPLEQTAKSEGAQSNSLQSGAASSTSAAGAKTKGTDTSQRKDKTGSHSKQDKEKNDEALHMGEDLYIGLLGEMHYVSLRKKDWEERLNEKLRARLRKRKARKKQEAGQEDDSSSDDDLCLPEDELGLILNDDFSVDRKSGVPVLHLNFLCREIIKLLLRPDLMPAIGRSIPYKDGDFPDWSCELFGKVEFMIELLPIPTLSSHYADLFSSSKESVKVKLNAEIFISLLTKDTLLVESEDDNMDIDLIIDRTNCTLSFLRLRPINPYIWGKFVYRNVSGVTFLRHVRIDTKRLKKRELVGKEPSYLSFRCPWPREATEYVNRSRRHSWPKQAIFKRIVSEGCRVVPVKAQNDDTLWTFSFDAANKVLISQGLSRHQRNCYKLWRLILRGYVKDVRHKHYQLFRAILFHACEIINDEIWENNPAVSVMYMIDRLIIDLQRKYVPDYFFSQVNLVYLLTQHDILCWTEKLQIIRHHFFTCVYFVVDQFAISAGKLLRTYDDTSNDINQFFEDRDFKRSFSDLILPAVWKEVKTLVEGSCYQKAEELILIFYEGALRLNLCLNFSCFFQRVLPKLDIAMQWCLALFIDKRQGTSFTKDVGKDQNIIPIADVFGPELVRILGLLDVPEICTKGKESVYFVDRVTYMFSLLGLDEAVITSLGFFLRKNYLPDRGVYVFDEAWSPRLDGRKSEKESLRKNGVDLILYDMFVTLYETLAGKERELEFKDLMLQFENVCDRLNTESAYRYLQEVWEWFGCLDKAECAKLKYLSLKNKVTDINDVD